MNSAPHSESRWEELQDKLQRALAEIARAAQRIGLSEREVDMVAALFANHLLMARTSRLRDLSVDTTIREFARAAAYEGRQIPETLREMDARLKSTLDALSQQRPTAEGRQR